MERESLLLRDKHSANTCPFTESGFYPDNQSAAFRTRLGATPIDLKWRADWQAKGMNTTQRCLKLVALPLLRFDIQQADRA